MKTKIIESTLTAFAVIGLSASASNAAPMAFSTEDYSDAGISTNGTLVGALNVSSAETVNSVDFLAVSAGDAIAGAIDLTTGGISVGSNAEVRIFNGGLGEYGGGPAGALTSSFFYGIGGGNGGVVFDNLVIGQQYELQLVLVYPNDLVKLDIWGDQTSNLGSPDIQLTNSEFLDPGQLVTITFTADGTTQGLYIEVTASNPGHFNALQLRAIPPDGPFEIISVTRADAETTLVFDSAPGAFYTIEFSFDLTTWLEITDSLPATGVTTTFIDDDVDIQAEERVFYRVIRNAAK